MVGGILALVILLIATLIEEDIGADFGIAEAFRQESSQVQDPLFFD